MRSQRPLVTSSSANAPVIHVIGDFFAYVCQFEKFFYGEEIFVLFGQSPVFDRLVSQIIRVLEHSVFSQLVVGVRTEHQVVHRPNTHASSNHTDTDHSDLMRRKWHSKEGDFRAWRLLLDAARSKDRHLQRAYWEPPDFILR